MSSFSENCVNGMEVNTEKVTENTQKSLMLITALNQVIGYEGT